MQALNSVLLLLLTISAPFVVADDFSDQCNGLSPKLKGIANTTIYTTQYLAKGSRYAGFFSMPVSADLCRVTAYTATTNRSGVNFEVWLPRNWTGRFMSHGNGGLSGCELASSVVYSQCADKTKLSGMEIWRPAQPRDLLPCRRTV
jgi:feruloyl esterase